jgi:threonine dehydratase
VVEPSGALTIAAFAFHADALDVPPEGDIVAVVSGGNVDLAQYRAYLEMPLPG